MSKIIGEINLILSEVGKNSNKHWKGQLFDDNLVVTTWGRVGYSNQSKDFPGAGKAFFDKKVKEKLAKGYSVQKTIQSTSATKAVEVTNISEIAKKQIKYGNNKELEKLIERLSIANIHKITSNTSLSYNDTTGLFSGPLGIVIPEATSAARNILAEIKPFVEKKEYSNEKLSSLVSSYLRLIPSSLGMRIKLESIFPSIDSIKDKLDILDSLDSSYILAIKPKDGAVKTIEEEKIFDLEFGILEDEKERKRLEDFYYGSKSVKHNYEHVKIKEIYRICINSVKERFNSKIGGVQEVFHGLPMSCLLSVFKSGLQISPPSTVAINGRLFQNGIYGAINSSKSLQYSYNRFIGNNNDGKGEAWMTVCDFAMGKTYFPHSYGISSIPTGYNSCWAKKENTGLRFDELVAYNNNQVNIKYLLHCHG